LNPQERDLLKGITNMAEPEGKMPETEAQSVDVAVDERTEEPFDQARAMETIRKQREEVKQMKKIASELERYKQAEEARKLADMSETDRLKAELDRVQNELKVKSIRTMQVDAAINTGLPNALADRLKGETPEEMEADAKAMLELIPKSKSAPNSGATNPGEKSNQAEDFETAHKRWKKSDQLTNPFAGGGVHFPNGAPD
jgi:hypothetical protein